MGMAAFHSSLLLVLVLFYSTGSVDSSPAAEKDLLQKSCLHASYPNICLRTLSSFPGHPNTPGDLAQAAVLVSLSRAKKASGYLAELRSQIIRTRNRREQRTLNDCVGQLGDSVDELSRSLSELKNLDRSGSTFRWKMSDAETWVSAALTNEDTCLDGFREMEGGNLRKMKFDLKHKISNVAKVTSNALYLINRLDQYDSNGK